MTLRSPPRADAAARPGALPIPFDRNISAFTHPNVLERWTADVAGIRAVEVGDNIITMFDVIGEDFWTGGGITAKKVTSQLRAIGNRPVTVQINSFGGNMFEGHAIYNVLREHKQEITVQVMGMAASAASIIAMAGNRIEIGASSFIMIHNCWITAVGNRHDFVATAEWLEPFDLSMRDIYAMRTGQKPEDVAKWLDAETYMSGREAIARGFADALLPADKMVVDETSKAADRSINELRAMELALVAAGHTRSQARERINKIKGFVTPGAGGGQDTPTPGAGDLELAGALAGLLSTIRS